LASNGCQEETYPNLLTQSACRKNTAMWQPQETSDPLKYLVCCLFLQHQ
jgi:hypothetical protein